MASQILGHRETDANILFQTSATSVAWHWPLGLSQQLEKARHFYHAQIGKHLNHLFGCYAHTAFPCKPLSFVSLSRFILSPCLPCHHDVQAPQQPWVATLGQHGTSIDQPYCPTRVTRHPTRTGVRVVQTPAPHASPLPDHFPRETMGFPHLCLFAPGYIWTWVLYGSRRGHL